MTQSYRDQSTCSVCNQTFNSDLELQQHEETAHARQESNDHRSDPRPNQGPDRIDPNYVDREQEKIA